MYEHKHGNMILGMILLLILTLGVNFVVTGQAPVTLEWKNTPQGKKKKEKKVVHVYLVYHNS